jgi:hypothetical protein
MVNAFYSAFLEIIHMEFMLLFPLYIIYILRFTLKSNHCSTQTPRSGMLYTSWPC